MGCDVMGFTSVLVALSAVFIVEEFSEDGGRSFLRNIVIIYQTARRNLVETAGFIN
jgi:hypothetical protein